jgi:hypothetical protein
MPRCECTGHAASDRDTAVRIADTVLDGIHRDRPAVDRDHIARLSVVPDTVGLTAARR